MRPLKLDSLARKSHGGLPAVAAAAAAIAAVGVWASNQVVRKLGIKDPQIVCIDEVAGVLITFEAKRIPNIA